MAGNLPPSLSPTKTNIPTSSWGRTRDCKTSAGILLPWPRGGYRQCWAHVDHWLLPSVIISLEFIPGPRSRPHGGWALLFPRRPGSLVQRNHPSPCHGYRQFKTPKLKKLTTFSKPGGVHQANTATARSFEVYGSYGQVFRSALGRGSGCDGHGAPDHRPCCCKPHHTTSLGTEQGTGTDNTQPPLVPQTHTGNVASDLLLQQPRFAGTQRPRAHKGAGALRDARLLVPPCPASEPNVPDKARFFERQQPVGSVLGPENSSERSVPFLNRGPFCKRSVWTGGRVLQESKRL